VKIVATPQPESSRPTRRHGRVGGRIGRTAGRGADVVSEFENYVKLNKKVPPEVVVSINKIEEPAKLADTISATWRSRSPRSSSSSSSTRCQAARAHPRPDGRRDRRVAGREEDPQPRQRQMEKTQREYYLNEQMKAIQKELGETEDGRDEISEMEKRIKKTRLSKEAREKSQWRAEEAPDHEPMSPRRRGAQLPRLALSIPWRKPTKIIKDLKYAEDISTPTTTASRRSRSASSSTSRSSSGSTKMKGSDPVPGRPPGVGKTSLGKSIAKADRPQLRAHVAGRRA